MRRETTAAPRRRRAVGIAPAFWMTVLALFIVCVGALPAAGDPVPPRQAASITVSVARSDTLWSIAAAHRLPGVTTAQMVRLIADANSLRRSGVKAGSILQVPVETDAGTAYAQVTDAPDGH